VFVSLPSLLFLLERLLSPLTSGNPVKPDDGANAELFEEAQCLGELMSCDSMEG
jgi:hypothetical protein